MHGKRIHVKTLGAYVWFSLLNKTGGKTPVLGQVWVWNRTDPKAGKHGASRWIRAKCFKKLLHFTILFGSVKEIANYKMSSQNFFSFVSEAGLILFGASKLSVSNRVFNGIR